MTARNRRLVQATVLAVVSLLVGGRWLAGAAADHVWAEALGAGAAHAAVWRASTLLLVVVFAVSLLWCLGNLYVVYRSIGSVHVPRRIGNLEVLEAVPRRYLLGTVVVLGLGLAVAFSYGADEWWVARALAGRSETLGVTDPALGRDAAYYLFRLPWALTLHGYALRITAAMTVLAVFLYGAMGALRWHHRRLAVTDLAQSHLAGLLTILAVVLVFGYRLEPAEFVAATPSLAADAVLTDIRIPVSRALAWVAGIAGAGSLLWLWVQRVAVVVVPWLLLGGASFAGHLVLPAFGTATRVPEELPLQGAAAAQEMLGALAYGIPARERALSPQSPPAAASLEHAPVWDGFAVALALNRIVGGGAHDRFAEASLGVYRAADGVPVPVFLTVRHVDLQAAEALGEDLSWMDVHGPRFGAARGAMAVSAHRTTPEGLPLFVADLAAPNVTTDQAVPLRVAADEFWLGPDRYDFAVVPADRPGVRGVVRGGLLRRLALAWMLQSPRLLSSGTFGDSAVLLWRRDPTDRLERYAPFAAFAHSRLAMVDGRLTWVAAGLVASRTFPLTQHVRWNGRVVRYLRHGLVGTVDAETGETAVYLVRNPDPLSAAWAQVLPDLVRPAGDMPRALVENLHYPAPLLRAQAEVLAARWSSADGRGPVETPQVFAWVGPTMADPTPRLRQLALVEEDGGVVLRGIVDGSIRDGAPVADVYRVQGAVELAGTSAIARRFDRLRGGQAGVQGPVRVVPLPDGLLALQSSYEAPEQGFGVPRLTDVAVGWGDAIGSGPTLATALGSASAGPVVETAAQNLRTQARLWYERMEAARRSGDWTAFGRAYDELGRLLMPRPDTGR